MGSEYLPYRIASSRGIGLLVDGSENVYVRRHAVSMLILIQVKQLKLSVLRFLLDLVA